jgi:hypothetical protein
VKAGGERLEGRAFENGYSSRKVIKVEGGEETEISRGFVEEGIVIEGNVKSSE